MNYFKLAADTWANAAIFRATRKRLKDYAYSRQWEDLTTTPEGKVITEGGLVRKDGRLPQTNNLIRPLIKSVVGRFRYNLTREELSTDDFLREAYEANQLDELDSRALEEFLISGCVIQRVGWEAFTDGEGISVDNVNPNRFFVNRFFDSRGKDIRFIGMIHDMPLDRIKLCFAAGDSCKSKEIEEVYSKCDDMRHASLSTIGKPGFEESFFYCADEFMCRVIEVWSYDFDTDGEGRPDPHWHCRFFAPDGTLIADTRSPFLHGSHPFALKFYPLTDGEVHSFIEDVVDQQRHINQLITTIDAILANSAKGVLLLPSDALVDGMNAEAAARLWNHPGGVIPVNSRASKFPQEVHSNGSCEGAYNLLDIEMRMFQQISGVSTAMQGMTPDSKTSASLYESQIYHSAISLLDIFETFNSFRSIRDRLILRSLR